MAYYKFDLTVTGGMNAEATAGYATAFFSNAAVDHSGPPVDIVNGALGPVTINTASDLDLTGDEEVWFIFDFKNSANTYIQTAVVGPYTVSAVGTVVTI